MKLKIRGRNELLTAEARDAIEWPIHFALTRFGCRIRRVTVEVKASNRMATEDGCCWRLEVHTSCPNRVICKASHSSVERAIAYCVARVARILELRLSTTAGWNNTLMKEGN